MEKKQIYLYSFIIVIIVGWVIMYKDKDQEVLLDETTETEEIEYTTILADKEAIVYKSPLCGCCVGFSTLIEEQKGTEVEIVTKENMTEIKKEHSIPRNMESCHTTIIDEYFFEGHIPFEVIEKVLEEKPDIDGLALPNMPAGTPGMPGIQTKPYDIYQLKDGVASLYISLPVNQ